jgi:hypothetical protein
LPRGFSGGLEAMSENQEIQVRKPRSSEEVERLVIEYEASGAEPGKFCRERQLARSVLHRHLQRRRLANYGPMPVQRLVAASLMETNDQGEPRESCALEVVLSSGRRIEVRPDFDRETLERLLKVLEGA